MALIKVNEKDLSWYYRQRVSGQLAVLVPGVATFGPVNDPVYLTSENFTQVLGTSSVDSRDTSYNQAASFIKAGADVLFWRIPLKGSAAASHTISDSVKYLEKGEVKTTPVVSVVVRAKYQGSFGNSLSYKCYRSGSSRGGSVPNYKFLVYNGSQVVETLLVNFEDQDSGYYYETVNQTSKYVEFVVDLSGKTVSTSITKKSLSSVSDLTVSLTEIFLENEVLNKKIDDVLSVELKVGSKTVEVTSFTFNKETQSLSIKPSESLTGDCDISLKYVVEGDLSGIYTMIESSKAINLVNGANGTYDKNQIVETILTDPVCQEVVKSLIDPLQYSFNLIVDGGYNSYTRQCLVSTLSNTSIKEESYTNQGDSVHQYTKKVVTLELGSPVVDDSTLFVEIYDSDSETPENKVITDITEELSKNGNLLSFTTDDPLDSENTRESALITALEKGHRVTVTVKGTKRSSFDSISQIDDMYVYLAENRGLAIYLVDGDKDWSAEEFFNYTSLPSSETSNLKLQSSAGFNTSYAAAYGPWTSAQLASTGVTRVLPGSYALITAWSQSIASGVPMYYAPAGTKRSALSLVNSTTYRVDSAINELWQNQDVTVSDGHKINPIINLRQYGYVIYGNSTLLKSRADGATSMLQSMSTRVLANLIKQRAFDISLSLQFDQIDQDLFSQFKTLLSTYMDTLKYKGALYDYLIIADYSAMTLDDLNNRTVPVTIKISPNPAAENFVINLEISQAGVSFADTEDQTASV